MKKYQLILALGIGAFSQTACTHLDGPISPDHGRATANNLQAQIIDPAPAEGLPQTDPAISQGAIERLRSGEVNGGEGGGESESFIPIIDISGGR